MSPQDEIRRMRAEQREPVPSMTPSLSGRLFVVAHPDSQMKIRLRRLHVGEKRRQGDLWTDPVTNQLVLLVLPWWRSYGTITNHHADHYRVLP